MGSGCNANRIQDDPSKVSNSVNPKLKHSSTTQNAQAEVNASAESVHASGIWEAIEQNNNARLKHILAQVEMIHSDFFNAKGQSFLHVAAMAGNSQAIGIILDSNIPTVSPDMLNSNLATPLHSAIISDKLEAVKTLIAYGADANIEDEHGQLPVLLCSIHGRLKILEALIEANDAGKLSEALNVDGKDRKGLCAVNCSAIKGEYDFCKLLLGKGKAKVDEPSKKGCTGLIYSSRGGYDQLVDLFISSGANKNHQDESGATALHHACEKNFPVVVSKLLKAGADANAQDLIGRTPIFETILNEAGKSLEVLLENSVDVNAIDSLGHTALFYAVQNNNEELVKILIEKGGADVNIYSMPNQNIEKEMTDPNNKSYNEYARTPIHSAASIGNAKMVIYLLSKGAKATEPGKCNNSALHICALVGDLDTAKELINAGVDILGKNSKGLTPIDLFQKHHPESLQKLMELVKSSTEPKVKTIEGELPGEAGDDELSMQLETSLQADSDPRIKLIGTIFGKKVSTALMKPEKRYKGLRWLMKNYSSAGLEAEGLKALLAAVVLGLEEKVHKMNVISLDLLDSLIINAAQLLNSTVMEELGVIDIIFVKAMSTTDRFLNKIIETLIKTGELPGVGAGYLINKSMVQLRAVSQIEKSQGAKRLKSFNIVVLIMLKLIDSFGPDNWPHNEIEELIIPEADTHNKAFKANIQQMITILKDSNTEMASVKPKEDESPTKKPVVGEEHIIFLQEGIATLYEKSEDMEWQDKYKLLTDILGEKNIVNFMAGVDICDAFINKALKHNRPLIKEKFMELVIPILSKIDTVNKRVRTKCRDFVITFWKYSIDNNDFMHKEFAGYLLNPQQHKLFLGIMEVIQEILKYLVSKKVVEQRNLEEGLGIALENILKPIVSELGNKSPQVRKVSMGLLATIVELIAVQTDKTGQSRVITALEAMFRPMKSVVKEKIFEKLNKDVVAQIKQIAEDKSSPEKMPTEEDKLIYAEPLSEELKTKLVSVLGYFSENIIQCLYSQNWASRSIALNKIKEELKFGVVEETTDNSVQRNVNIALVPIVKATEPWIVVVKHVLSDPVLKIYIDGLELVKDMIITFKKHITNQEEAIKINDLLISGVIEKLGDQKQKIREKSIELLFSLLKEDLIKPELLSAKILTSFEKAKKATHENLLCSVLNVCKECTSQYKITQSNNAILNDYIQLLNNSLKCSVPGVRQLSEELYVALYAIHGEILNQYLVNQKAIVLKKLQSLCKNESTAATASKSGTNFHPKKTIDPNFSSIKILYVPGCETLLNSEDPSQRIKGIIAIKKNISKQQSLKDMDSDKAHSILDELSMFMRTALNETNPDVYLELLKLLKFALNQLLKHLSTLDLQITVNSIISILLPKTIASPNYKIQIASDKFIVALGKEPLIGPVIIIKNVFRLLDKLAAEYVSYQKTLRASGSQAGFGKQLGGFDAGQNTAAIIKYLGIANIILTHYSADIANSKEAIDFFSDSAVTLFNTYEDKCQIKETVSQFSRDIRAVNPKAFEVPLAKKSSEVKAKLTEILNSSQGLFEEKMLKGKESMWGAGKDSGMMKNAPDSGSMLPSLHPTVRKEEEKGGKHSQLNPRRLAKMGDSTGSLRQGLPPLIGSDKPPQLLPPLVLRKTQPVNDRKDKPKWLDEKGEIIDEGESDSPSKRMTAQSFMFHK